MLNVKQEKFCVEYARCGNATEAYKAAGYVATGESARRNASRMLTKADIQKRLAEITAEMAKPVIMNAEERQAMLTSIVKNAFGDCDYNSACKAINILNKMQGSYVNKLEIGGPDGGPIEFSWAGGDGG